MIQRKVCAQIPAVDVVQKAQKVEAGLAEFESLDKQWSLEKFTKIDHEDIEHVVRGIKGMYPDAKQIQKQEPLMFKMTDHDLQIIDFNYKPTKTSAAYGRVLHAKVPLPTARGGYE